MAETFGSIVAFLSLPKDVEGSWRPRVKPHMLFFMVLAHVLAALGVYFGAVHEQALRIFLELVLVYQIGGFGITAGAHRLWAHRSYKARAPVRLFLMLMSSACHQGSIYHWCRDHRVHHKFSETDGDPHNAKRGLWFSHIGWLMVDKHPEVIRRGKQLDLSDLERDPIVMFQHRHYVKMSLLFCYLLPGVYGMLMYNSYWLGVLLFGFTRHLLILHATWLVNSIAHKYGDRPYDSEISPSESIPTAIFAVGEGWHNWHHTYPFDYACSEYGISGQYNPSKLVIDSFAWLGLVSDRKRATHLWEQRRERLERRRLQAGQN